MKKYLILSAIACAMSAAPVWAGYISGFTDYYKIPGMGAPLYGPGTFALGTHWTVEAGTGAQWQAHGGPDGSLSLEIGGTGTVKLYTTAPAAGTVSFLYIWDTGMPGLDPDAAQGDRATFFASGLTQQIGGDADTVGNGSASLTDVPNRVFGWEVSNDGSGFNSLTVGGFRAPGVPGVPDLANTALLLTSSLAGLVALRRRLS